MNLSEGQILDGKYRIVRQIGAGGMGAVFLGENIRVKKTVAIKVLHASPSGVDDAVQRFEREAQAAGQIGSDHIVEVHDLGKTPEGDHFMVMEYLEGESLRQRIQRGQSVEPAVVVPIVIQLLDGLAAAHEAGIVHRDLKPDNVFIVAKKAGRKDFVKILDFGISKFLQIGQTGATTRTGMVMGSPNYMSPEQVKSSHEVDGRSDLYTVGVILFEAVTGRVPFKANTFAELLFKIVYEPLPDPRTLNPSVDEAFAKLIVKACSSKADDRFQSALEFRLALEPFVPHALRSVPAPRRPTPLATPAVQAALADMGPDEGGRTVAIGAGHPAAGTPFSAVVANAQGSTAQGVPAPFPSQPGAPSPSQSGGFAPPSGSGQFSNQASQSGGFANQASQSGGFANQASQSGGFANQASQSGGFANQASQSGGFANQASQSGGFGNQSQSGGHVIGGGAITGGRFSSTLGPSVGSVDDAGKKSRAPLLIVLVAGLALAAGVTGFFVMKHAPSTASQSSPGEQAAAPPPRSTPAVSTTSAPTATAAASAPSTASSSEPSASAHAVSSSAPSASAKSATVPPKAWHPGGKRPGSDVLGY